MIELFSTRESLVSDIPAGDGKISNLFYSVLAKSEYKDGVHRLFVESQLRLSDRWKGVRMKATVLVSGKETDDTWLVDIVTYTD